MKDERRPGQQAPGPWSLILFLASAALGAAGCRTSRATIAPADAAADSSAAPADAGADGIGEATNDSGAGASPDLAAPLDRGLPPDTRETVAVDAAEEGVGFLGGRVVLWLDAALGIAVTSGPLGTWTDQSEHHNNAVNPTAGMGTSPAIERNAIAGLPAVQFSGDTDRLIIPDSPSLHFGTDDVIAAVVLKHQSAQAPYSRLVISKHRLVDPFIGMALFVNYENGFGASAQLAYHQVAAAYTPPGVSFADNVPRLYVFRRAGDELELRVNGQSVALTSAQLGNAPVNLTNTSNVTIGGQGAAFQTLKGSIAEIVVAHGAVTGEELRRLERYLLQKYRLLL